MRVLEPVGEAPKPNGVMAPRPASLNGKVVGVLDGWGHRKEDGSFEMYPLMAEICHLLEARFELGDSFWVKKPNIAQAVPKARLEEVAARADVVLNGQCL